jgi:hypothetical protein
MLEDDDPTWFRALADDFGKRHKLRPVLFQDGPDAFRAHYGSNARGKPLYELSIDFAHQSASLVTRAVPYGEVAQVFRSGEQEQFSPFDDGPAYPTRLDIRAWLEQRCRGRPMID